jgi:hypothetical protein
MQSSKKSLVNMKSPFIEIKPGLLINQKNILWVQKYGECIYFSQSDKVHELCNTSKQEDVYFKQINNIFFGLPEKIQQKNES